MVFIFINILNVYAIGVSPGRRILDYNPDSIVETYIQIHNREGEKKTVDILVKGNLAQYITIDNKEIQFDKGETIKTVPLKIVIPRDLSPGRKEGIVEISEKETLDVVEDSTAIGARLQVLSFIILDVSVIGKYAGLNLNIVPNEVETKFLSTVVNEGRELIQSAKLMIHIYKSSTLINELESDTFSLLVGERKEITFNSVLDDGSYNIISVLNYDGKVYKVENKLKIDFKKLLEVISVGVDEFNLGEIAKIGINVKNIGQYKVDDLYAVMEIYGNRDKIAEITSERLEINIGENALLNVYWDTKNIRIGKYNAKVTLYYSDKKTENNLEIIVEENNIKTNLLTGGAVVDDDKKTRIKPMTFIAVVFVLIVIINIILFVRYKKRKKGLTIR